MNHPSPGCIPLFSGFFHPVTIPARHRFSIHLHNSIINRTGAFAGSAGVPTPIVRAYLFTQPKHAPVISQSAAGLLHFN